MNSPQYQGARFYKCALQLNSASYAGEYRLDAHKLREDDYNQEVLDKCEKNNIEVVGLADHGTVSDSQALRKTLEDGDITVFPGFEISSSEKIHIVCLYPEGTEEGELIGNLKQLMGDNYEKLKKDKTHPSSRSCEEMAEEIINRHKGLWYAAHLMNKNGLLKLSGAGDNYSHLWKNHEIVMAGQIAGTVQDITDQRYKDIIENKNPDYERKRPIAIINAKDIAKPEDIDDPSASCLIKMTEPTMDSLRAAFHDPESRIMLNHNVQHSYHSKIETIKLEGGLYKDCELSLSGKLNVIIGGHGTGKSTLIESLRYVFGKEPAASVAKTYQNLCRNNLVDSRISITVCSNAQNQNKYTISRRYGEPAVVYNQAGQASRLRVQQIVPAVEIYSQSEILEIAKSNEDQIKLLDRFLPSQDQRKEYIVEIKKHLKKNGEELAAALREKDDLEARQNTIPQLQEEINQLVQLGIEKKLKNVSLLEKEVTMIEKSKQQFEEAEDWLRACNYLFDFDFFNTSQFDQLPNHQLLAEIKIALEKLEKSYHKACTVLEKEKDACRQIIIDKEQQWQQLKVNINNELHEAINTLPDHGGKTGTQLATEYRQLQQKLIAAEGERNAFKRFDLYVKELQKERDELLKDYRDISYSRSRELKDAIEKLNKGVLKDRLKIEFTPAGNRSALKNFFANFSGIGERKLEWVDKADAIFPADLAKAVQDKDKDTLFAHYKKYGLTDGTAERIIGMQASQRLELEEIEMEDRITIKLNTRHDQGGQPHFRELDDLSTGQKCIAILNILLLSNNDPLIMDQPEDNLDNAFIADRIVKDLRIQKNSRQFIFATHNANIPVFGDAELIAVLKMEHDEAIIDELGSIDKSGIQTAAAQILEGGEAAFAARKEKYGF